MSGFVYAIECGDAVKIGYAIDPIRRLGQLNVGTAVEHQLIGCARGDQSHEKEIHILLMPWRIRGEWFAKAGLVLKFLSLLPKPASDEPLIRRLGGSRALAAALTKSGTPITAQAVSQWRQIPTNRARAVAKATGISLHALRPDLWPEGSI